MKISKKILTILLAGILSMGAISSTFAAKTEVSFSDLEEGKWYTEAMIDLAEKGILKGNNGLIQPNKNLTRAEYAQILHNVLKFEGIIGLENVPDVKESDWFYEAVRGATAHGVLRGDGGMELRPNDPLTREEMFVMTVRAFELSDWENPMTKDYTYLYKDAKDVSSWSKEAINILLDQKVIQGNHENKLLPKKNITRAEASIVISQMEEVKNLKPNTSVGQKPTTKPSEKPANKPGKVWVPEVGHWEDVYKKKLVKKGFSIYHPDEYEIIETYEYYFPAHDKTFYTIEETNKFGMECVRKGLPNNFQIITIRKRGKLIKPAWEEVISEPVYENVKVGTKWVVDVPGYWKDVE